MEQLFDFYYRAAMVLAGGGVAVLAVSLWRRSAEAKRAAAQTPPEAEQAADSGSAPG